MAALAIVGIGRVIDLVGARVETQGLVVLAKVATAIHRPRFRQIPHDLAAVGVQNPGGGQLERLVIVAPDLEPQGLDGHFLSSVDLETLDLEVPGLHVFDLDQDGLLGRGDRGAQAGHRQKDRGG